MTKPSIDQIENAMRVASKLTGVDTRINRELIGTILNGIPDDVEATKIVGAFGDARILSAMKNEAPTTVIQAFEGILGVTVNLPSGDAKDDNPTSHEDKGDYNGPAGENGNSNEHEGQDESEGNGEGEGKGKSQDGDGEGEGGQGMEQMDIGQLMEELNKKLTQQMAAQKIPDNSFPEVVNGWRCHPEMLDEEFKKKKPDWWDKVVKRITHKYANNIPDTMNFWLFGPAGCGKTYGVNQLAKYLTGHKEGALEINPPMSKGDIMGFYDLHNVYHPSTLLNAIMMKGPMFVLLDEIRCVPQEIQLLLNCILEQGRVLVTKRQDIGNGNYAEYTEYIDRDQMCIIFMCDNTNGDGQTEEFVGNSMDCSCRDRAKVIHIDYDTDVASALFQPQRAMFIDLWNKACIQANQPRAVRSFRALKGMMYDEACGLSLIDVVMDNVVKGIDRDDAKTINDALKNICAIRKVVNPYIQVVDFIVTSMEW